MSKRKPLHSMGNASSKKTFGSSSSNINFNFRPTSMQEDRGGTKPIPPPSSVSLVLVTMAIHICKMTLLYQPRLKAVIYLALVFVGSILADVLPIPKTYFSKSNNVFNRFFIKWAWGWLLATAGPWILLTAHTISCGRRLMIIKHVARLLFATLAWMLWMNIFHYVETHYGRCLNTKDPALQFKSKCLQAGKFWNALDISGHAFIIIYSSLILSEEAHSMIGWERIENLIMNEEYSRKTSNEAPSGNLSNLSNEDFDFMKKAYEALTPFLRGIFIAMTLQQIVWEVMLFATILYFHLLVEKFVGAVAAILTWYVSYYWLFRKPELGLIMPGEGIFKYNDLKKQAKQDNGFKNKKRSVPTKGPTFMGMPLRTGKKEVEKGDLPNRDLETDTLYRRNL